MSKQFKNPFTNNVLDAKKRFEIRKDTAEQYRLHEDNKKRFIGKNLSHKVSVDYLMNSEEMCHAWMIKIQDIEETLYTQLTMTSDKSEVLLISFDEKLDKTGQILKVPVDLIESVKVILNEEDTEYLKSICTEEQNKAIDKVLL